MPRAQEVTGTDPVKHLVLVVSSLILLLDLEYQLGGVQTLAIEAESLRRLIVNIRSHLDIYSRNDWTA